VRLETRKDRWFGREVWCLSLSSTAVHEHVHVNVQVVVAGFFLTAGDEEDRRTPRPSIAGDLVFFELEPDYRTARHVLTTLPGRRETPLAGRFEGK